MSLLKTAGIQHPSLGTQSITIDGTTGAVSFPNGPSIGDITAVTAGTGISGGGSSGDVTITNSMATAIDAKGDLIAGTAADTFSRLAIGSNDQVLTADSSTATGLKWATPSSGGGMTLISTTTLSNRQTDLSSIPQTYNNLVILINGANFPTYDTNIDFRPNGLTNIMTTDNRQNSGGSNNSTTITDSQWNTGTNAGNISRNSSNNTWVITIHNYANSSYYKPFTAFGFFKQYSPSYSTAVGSWGGIQTNDAITSITLYLGQNVSYNSGQVLLYGVK